MRHTVVLGESSESHQRGDDRTALAFLAMDETQARSILDWHYDPPYDLYDLSAGDAEETVQAFLDPAYAYYALLSAQGDLVAYCCFGADAQVPGGDYHAPALDIGLGVRPDLTGQGRGSTYVQAVLDLARRTFSPSAFRVTIAEFNRRALRVWEKAGFRRVQRFRRGQDGRAFLVLVREAAGPETWMSTVESTTSSRRE